MSFQHSRNLVAALHIWSLCIPNPPAFLGLQMSFQATKIGLLPSAPARNRAAYLSIWLETGSSNAWFQETPKASKVDLTSWYLPAIKRSLFLFPTMKFPNHPIHQGLTIAREKREGSSSLFSLKREGERGHLALSLYCRSPLDHHESEQSGKVHQCSHLTNLSGSPPFILRIW